MNHLFPSNPEEYEQYQEFLANGGNGVFESDEYHAMMNQMADEAENSVPDPMPADFGHDDDDDDDEPWDGFNSDVEADADALASAGWGTDEDYGGGYEEW